ncbi:hypothetical protein N865_19945 [Intrasporangium oryzae NRRL B-24470]|uniref:Uncharacterized protein n=1 Tax=Intrasporangium oryzae NRRL B-24470 TaxID=1386089 RepID=W9G3J6_9MICO|nr:hypothetical protein [Intrasporangium oryzae]EWS99881.1 hypothetical protein N865_19945 [Intrasporangium oryzae NRRL B-24470]
MNWLTDRIAQMGFEFDALDRSAERLDDSSVDMVSMPNLVEGLGSRVDGPGLEELYATRACVFIERAAPATFRFDAATPTTQAPSAYTLAIWDAARRGVLYIPETPENPELDSSLQLFVPRPDGRIGRIGRIQTYGRFEGNDAYIERVERVAPGPCSDGPCTDWGMGCGNGCRCEKFEAPQAHAFSLPDRTDLRVYGLACR